MTRTPGESAVAGGIVQAHEQNQSLPFQCSWIADNMHEGLDRRWPKLIDCLLTLAVLLCLVPRLLLQAAVLVSAVAQEQR